ncbi:hypothetical protein R6Q59_009831 [Mikania micrantha]
MSVACKYVAVTISSVFAASWCGSGVLSESSHRRLSVGSELNSSFQTPFQVMAVASSTMSVRRTADRALRSPHHSHRQ